MMRWISFLLVLALLCPQTAFAQQRERTEGAREYFTTNSSRRLTVRVQVWGEVPLSGTHHVPDNTTLLDLISYAGGLKGDLDDATIVLRRDDPNASQELSGDELLNGAKARKIVVQNGDVVYVNVDNSDDLMENLTVVSTIAGVISSLILTYLLVRDRL